jgi:glycosyltransferase involved in cell wall biosynthesis
MRARAAGLTNVHVLNLFVSHRDGGSFSSTEKRALTEDHAKILRAIHPTYREDVRRYIRRNALGPLRSTIAAVICLVEKSRNTRLLVTFARGGGSDYYARRLVEETAGKGDSIIQASILSGSNDIRLDIFTPEGTFQFGTGPLEDLTIFFERFDITEVTINQLYVSEDPNRILDFFRAQKERHSFHLTYLLHDFFSLCPSATLITGDGAFCGAPNDLAACDRCLASSDFDAWNYMPRQTSIERWRRSWLQFFNEACDEVVVFSISSKELFLRVYGDVRCNIRYRPHRAYIDHVHEPISLAFDQLRIGIFGNLSVAKGANVARRLCDHIDNARLPIEVHHFGKLSDEMSARCFKAHGPYARAQLRSLIVSTGVNVAFLPSIWPETFSFVLDESMLLSLPIVSFDLGAQAERTRNYARGLVLTSQEPAFIAEQIQQFFSKLKCDASVGKLPANN